MIFPGWAPCLLSRHAVVWLGYLVYCAFVCLFVCTVTSFSTAEKCSGVKLRMLVPLLSGMSFSHLGEVSPRGSSPRSLKTRQGGGRGMVGYASCWSTC